MQTDQLVDSERMKADFDALSKIGSTGDGGVHRVRIGARIYHGAPLRLASGDLEESLAQSAVKRLVHALVAPAPAITRAGETEPDRNVENQR